MVHARRNVLILGLMLAMIVTMTVMLMQDHRGSRISGSVRMDAAVVSAVALSAERSPFHRRRAEELFVLLTQAGDRAFRAKDWSQAQTAYAKALRLSPNNPELLTQYAQVLYLQRRFDLAIDVLYRRRLADPTRVNAHTDLAVALYRVKRYDDARLVLQDGLNTVSDAQAGPLYFIAAQLYGESGSVEMRDQMIAAAHARLAPEELRLASRLWEAQTKQQLDDALEQHDIEVRAANDANEKRANP